MSELLNLIETGDGSHTLYCHNYNESYHSTTGALRESFVKYCEPCNILSLAKKGNIRILDVGFGLGYNILAALYIVKGLESFSRIEVVSLEKNLISSKVLDLLSIPARYRDYYEIVKKVSATLAFENKNVKISLVLGDARDTLKKVEGKFNAVFFDPFSLRKNPEMWSVELFCEVAKKMTDNAILSTYSSSTAVRCGLMEADFKIAPGPGDGMKKEGTIASKKSDIGFFPEKTSLKFSNSPEKMPYYDPDLNFTKDQIIKYREALQKEQNQFKSEVSTSESL